MQKEVEVRTLLNTRTGVKYIAVSDLILYLNGMKEERTDEVKKFIDNVILELSTAQAKFEYQPA